MMDKKGVGVQQVFIFIVAAITFALILIFGYGAISDFLDKGEQVEFFQFKTELESSVKRVYAEFGAVRQTEYLLPAKYSQICFVNLDAPYDASLCGFDQIACDTWETAQDPNEEIVGYDATDENVFLKPPAPVALKVFHIEIDGGSGYYCTNIEKGRFSLRLEGKGSLTSIGDMVR